MAKLLKDGLELTPDYSSVDPSAWDMVTPDAGGLAIAASVITLLIIVPL